MDGSKYENPRKLKVTSLDAVDEKVSTGEVTQELETIEEAHEVADVGEVGFTNPESRTAFKDEVFDRVVTVVALSRESFKRGSNEYKVRDYDKVGLQNTALVRAFYDRFQAQCDQLELAIARNSDVGVYVAQINRSYNLIEDKIELINQAIHTAHENTSEETTVPAHDLSHEVVSKRFKDILRRANVPDDEIERLTRKSIDAVYKNKSIATNPELLEQEINRILGNAEKEANLKPVSEVLVSASEVEASPAAVESHIQSEFVSLSDINRALTKLTELLAKGKISDKSEILHDEITHGVQLKKKLYALKHRIQQYHSDPHHAQKQLERSTRDFIDASRQVEELFQTITVKMASDGEASTPELVTEETAVSTEVQPTVLVEPVTQPLVLENRMRVDMEKLDLTNRMRVGMTPLILDESMRVETKSALTDLFNQAKEQTTWVAGHDDEETIKTLWENYNRLNQTEGNNESIRKLLQSIIEMTEYAGLSQQAFDAELENSVLTAEQRTTAIMLYEKYVRDKQKSVSREQLAQDIADIKNFFSLEGVGLEDIRNRVTVLEEAIAKRTWSKTPEEDVLGNFQALILDVRRQTTEKKAQDTFNVLQAYYVDQLQQQAKEKITQENTLQQYERSKRDYLTALERLQSIRSAIASGQMPKRAADEFLDPAIDDVERAQREYQTNLHNVEVFKKIDTTEVTAAESGKLRRSFINRNAKAAPEKNVNNDSSTEVVAGVELHDPVAVQERAAGEPVFSKMATLVEPAPIDNLILKESDDEVSKLVDEDADPVETESIIEQHPVLNTEILQRYLSPLPREAALQADAFNDWIDKIANQNLFSKNRVLSFIYSDAESGFEILKKRPWSEIKTIFTSRDPGQERNILTQLGINAHEYATWKKMYDSVMTNPDVRPLIKDNYTFGEIMLLQFAYQEQQKNNRTS